MTSPPARSDVTGQAPPRQAARAFVTVPMEAAASRPVRVSSWGSTRLSSGLSITAALIVSACAGSDKAPMPAVKPEIQAPASRAVTVTDADAGTPVALGGAQELVVRLATAVVDGQEWSLADLSPPGVLAASARTFERVPRGVAVEAEGDSIWRFKPLAAGSTALRFELKRPRGLEPPSRVATYVVTVRAAEAAVPVAAERR